MEASVPHIRLNPAIVCAILAFAPLVAHAQGHVLDNGRVHLDLGDPNYGPADNPNRFDSVTWTNSSGAVTGNFAATGGPLVCGDVYETFGEARGDDTAEEPRFIVAGTTATWKAVTAGLVGSTHTAKKACEGTVVAGTVASSYFVVKSAAKINLFKVKRAFTFNDSGSGVNNNLRPFMARVSDVTYDTVLAPDSSNAIQTYSASNCDGSCSITNWNGKWFADDDGTGNGIMIIRSATSKLPAELLLDHDGWSNSNVTSILLPPPSNGWSGTITEVQYACFYDPITWTTSARAAGRLPIGCAAK